MSAPTTARCGLVLAWLAGCGTPNARPAIDAGPGTGDDAQVSPDAAPDAAPLAVDAGLDAALGTLPLSGAITPVHDPSAIATATGYYLFATGQGLPVFHSTDLLSWTAAGRVFESKPAWITTTPPTSPNELWAPDIAFFGGQYHLYYAASSFGSRASCIGHATSPSLDPPTWVDRGAPVVCSTTADPWNAIDPNHVLDADGRAWLVFGSWWGGIKAIELDADGDRRSPALYSLATRANNAVEAPYVIRRGGYYYLFESVDVCCSGVNSTYKQLVGRATAITGPYVDRAGVPLLSGGGTLLVAGDSRWRGPGHNAVLSTPLGDVNLYHAYDATQGGRPTLRISTLSWDADDWPVSAGP
jgi:arabinan endo-1,5-alpha-L-arabinosidase